MKMNKNIIQRFLLFIFLVIVFHIVNYVYFTNKENMASNPTQIQTNEIARFINANAKQLTEIVKEVDPKVISELIKAGTTTIQKVSNVQSTP